MKRLPWKSILLTLSMTVFIWGQTSAQPGFDKSIGNEIIKVLTAPGMKCLDVTVDSIYLWVPDNASRKIYRMNSSDGMVNLSEPYPEGVLFCNGITCDGINIWLCGAETVDGDGSKVYKINRKTGLVTSDYNYPGEYDGNWPQGLTYAGSRLWANNLETHTLDRLDPNTLELLGTLPAPTDNSTGIATYNQAFWVSDPSTGKIYKLDQASGAILGSMDMPAPDCNGMEWEGEYLWTVSWSEQKIYKLDVGELGLNEPKEQTFKVFPNPCRSQITLAFKNSSGEIMLTDNCGKCALTKVIDGPACELDLEGLAPGLYFLTVTDGRTTSYEKIILLPRL